MQATDGLELKRSQILKDRQAIQKLFQKSAKTFKVKPLKVRYLFTEEEDGPKVLFVAPKKVFRSAVKRNKVKRVLREAYRLQQQKLEDQKVHVAFIYNGHYPIEYSQVYASVGRILETITHDT
jgi:ribonuclease P protein component